MAEVAVSAATLPPEELAGDDRVEAIESAEGMTYVEDWERIDREIDSGSRVRWLDDPAWRWYGAALPLVEAGVIGCPVCWEGRPEGVTCGFCLRTGPDGAMPRTHPRAPLASAVRFRAKARAKRPKAAPAPVEAPEMEPAA